MADTRVKVYEDLWPGPDTGWACAVCTDGEYEDGGPLKAADEKGAIAEATRAFPGCEIIVGEPHVDDSPAREW